MNPVVDTAYFAIPASEMMLDLLMTILKGALILGLALLLIQLFRKSSASFRHNLIFAAMASLIIIPLLSFFLPSWNLSLVPESLVSYRTTEVMDAVPGSNASISEHSNDLVRQPGVNNVESTSGDEQKANPGGSIDSDGKSKAGISIPLVALIIWAAVALIILFIQVIRTAGISLLTSWSAPIKNDRLNALFAELKEQAGIKQHIHLLKCELAAIPLTCGVFKPSIILTTDFEDWPEEKTRAILQHELCHIKRKDNLVQLVVSIICALHWFNPLVWIALHRLQYEREIACDNAVLNKGTVASVYAKVLLKTVTEMSESRKRHLLPAALAKNPGVKARLKSILDPAVNRKSPNMISSLVLVAVILLSTIPLAAFQPWSQPAVLSLENVADTMSQPNSSKPSRDYEETPLIFQQSSRAYQYFYDDENYAAAGKLFGSIAKRYPFAAHIQIMYGHCLMQTEQYEKAIAAYRNTLSLRHGFYHFDNFLAAAYILSGDEDRGFHWMYKAFAKGYSSYDEDNVIDYSGIYNNPKYKRLQDALKNGNVESLRNVYFNPTYENDPIPVIQIPEVTEELKHLLDIVQHHFDTDSREAAIRWIAGHGSQVARDVLERLIVEDNDEDVIEEAVEEYAETNMPGISERLYELSTMTKHPAAHVEIARYIYTTLPDEAFQLLRSVIYSRVNSDYHNDTLRLLGRMKNEHARRLLLEIIQTHPSERIIVRAKKELLKSGIASDK